MKVKAVVLGVLMSVLLSGCTVDSPQGRITLSYDSNIKSDNTVVTTDSGQIYTIDTSSVRAYVDQLLASVELPDGVSSSELNSFVYDKLETMGIDVDTMNFDSVEDAELAEDEILKSLEEQGVDTSNMKIDLSNFVGE